MEVRKTAIEGVIEILPKVFGDARGCFFESYSAREFGRLGIRTDFVQDNESHSTKGVLRGLHFQKPPYAQAKLVRVASGSVLDVAVDIRRGSPTYGQHVAVKLDCEKRNMLFIPEGFAHGFLALEDGTTFLYKCGAFYNKESEGGLIWNDATLGINWGIETPVLSDKDLFNPSFDGFVSPFDYGQCR